MLRKVISSSIATVLLSSILVGAAPSAVASCVFDPDALTFHEMIDQGTTGNEDFPIMFLGVVASWSDVGGRPGGGEAIARLAVGEHPVGNAPLVSDVRFYRQYPGVSSSVEFEFRRDGRYAVVAPAWTTGPSSPMAAVARPADSIGTGSVSSCSTPAHAEPPPTATGRQGSRFREARDVARI